MNSYLDRGLGALRTIAIGVIANLRNNAGTVKVDNLSSITAFGEKK